MPQQKPDVPGNWRYITLLILITFLATAIPYVSRKQSTAMNPGPKCLGEAFSPLVTLRVGGTMDLKEALRRLADLSCNELDTDLQSGVEIRVNFVQLPWNDVAHRICTDQEVRCWAENGVLHAKIRYTKPIQRDLRNYYEN